MEISKNVISPYLCPASIKRMSSLDGFHCGMGMNFQCKREGNPQPCPCRGTENQWGAFPRGGREQQLVQFQLHFPFHDGKTQNRMEFPANSSSPCKLSINKYSGLNPNGECREGGEGSKILIRGFYLTSMGNYIRTVISLSNLVFIQSSSVTLSFLWNLFIPHSLNLGKLSTRLPKVTVQHQALAIPPNPISLPGRDIPGWARLGHQAQQHSPKSCRGAELCHRDPQSAGLG